MVKKSISLLLCCLMLTMAGCTGNQVDGQDSPSAPHSEQAQTGTFNNGGSLNNLSDVEADAWYAEAVVYCMDNGIMSGTSGTRFSPQASMSRAMMATVLWNLDGKPASGGNASFSDVDAQAWYTDAVRWAAQENIVSGYSGAVFGANDQVTREQIAAMLYRYEAYKSGEVSVAVEPAFSDSNAISGWAQAAVAWAANRQIVSGKPGNVFDPLAGATRAEVAMMVYRYASGEGQMPEPEKPSEIKALVAYFSATGNTAQIAELIAEETGATLYQITPETLYTTADLNYNESSSRSSREQNDPAARPAIAGSVEQMEQYDVVYLGYPIWFGQAPRIISTFLESYDFSGKTVAPFCTSGGSGVGSSDTNLHSLCPDSANWMPGRRFTASASQQTVKSWIDGLELTRSAPQAAGDFNFETKTVLLNSGYEMPILGLGTYSLSDEECHNSVTALLDAGGRLIDTAFMYHNEASVGRAVRESSVPREDIFVITKLYPSQFANAGEAINEALEKLDIGYLDMLLLHHPGSSDVEAYKAMEQAVADGKIRSIGLSNWYVEELEALLPQITIMPALVQNEIHPYYQENDVIPYIQKLGIVVQGWYPLGGRGHTAALLGDEVISSIAQAHNVSPAQVILRWNLQKGVVVIPGSSNPEHIRENLNLFGFVLTDEEMAAINALDRDEKHDWY